MDVMFKFGINVNVVNSTLESKYGTNKFIKVPKTLDKTYKVSCKKTIKINKNSVCNISLKFNAKKIKIEIVLTA